MDRGREGAGDLYHQETKYRRESLPRGGLDWAHQPPRYKESAHALEHFSIRPLDPKSGKSLWEAIAQRRSVREFSQQSISFPEISQLIWATQGITLNAQGFDFRASPSAGALYPIETYLVANRVAEIPAGLYHYDVRDAQLVLFREGHFGPELALAGLGQEMLEEAACVFVWTAMVGRSKWKYRERAYRYIYMDAGHIGHALYLAATALDLGCCTVGAFFDDEVDHLIGVDGEQEISVYLGAVGHARRRSSK
ncbi:MAG TPA: SagB/ThcOx family dehydrogenase [Thermodesulfobacteriota bacterium]|nr:SagB/ThcOx family dehydrogenase [Thermodesulfobacteriota bacterium]